VDFIDRLAGFLRDILGDGGGTTGKSSRPAGYQDPDLRDAWEELDDYMRGGTGERRGDPAGGSRAGQGGGHESRRTRGPADESLRQDYANLEVPFGADIETVRKSYKTLMLRYHPDKHAGDPEKQRIALEITKKVNQSFEKIRSRQEG
jgi:DnaJ-domain-containing protein 1